MKPNLTEPFIPLPSRSPFTYTSSVLSAPPSNTDVEVQIFSDSHGNHLSLFE